MVLPILTSAGCLILGIITVAAGLELRRNYKEAIDTLQIMADKHGLADSEAALGLTIGRLRGGHKMGLVQILFGAVSQIAGIATLISSQIQTYQIMMLLLVASIGMVAVPISLSLSRDVARRMKGVSL